MVFFNSVATQGLPYYEVSQGPGGQLVAAPVRTSIEERTEYLAQRERKKLMCLALTCLCFTGGTSIPIYFAINKYPEKDPVGAYIFAVSYSLIALSCLGMFLKQACCHRTQCCNRNDVRV